MEICLSNMFFYRQDV